VTKHDERAPTSMNAAADLCRLVVVSSTRSAELALPANVPLVDMVPSLVDQVDGLEPELAGRGVVVQRLGGPPLDEGSTPAMLGLRDGETLYLRPRDAPMPALTHDDLIDGVAARLRDRRGRWQPATTRRLFLGLATAVLALGLAIVLVDGPAPLRATVAGVAATALVIAALAAARAFGDRSAAVLLGCAAVGYAAATGYLVLGGAGAGGAAAGGAGAGGAGAGGAVAGGAVAGGAADGARTCWRRRPWPRRRRSWPGSRPARPAHSCSDSA
jgi:ESX secretion system protein EccD